MDVGFRLVLLKRVSVGTPVFTHTCPRPIDTHDVCRDHSTGVRQIWLSSGRGGMRLSCCARVFCVPRSFGYCSRCFTDLAPLAECCDLGLTCTFLPDQQQSLRTTRQESVFVILYVCSSFWPCDGAVTVLPQSQRQLGTSAFHATSTLQERRPNLLTEPEKSSDRNESYFGSYLGTK